ncbi:MAG: DUF6250 domain-containing protein [Bacteroidaceae bacterium]|nr:DUF6250 domain-containing protein [Bacteroidaceae bacterium]
MKKLVLTFTLLVSLNSTASAQGTHWRIEAESPDTRILLRGDTLDITTPKGLSLWWDQPMEAPCTIEYKACVILDHGPCDRLSDLNCFWMSTGTPEGGTASDPLKGISHRGGKFVESYRQRCYYLGYGGNYNTTTRFRHYKGDTLAVSDPTHRPPVLQEYTDSAHLLRPNHWYDIRIEVFDDGRTQYYIDGELLVSYKDPAPPRKGWFAFRTTWSHTRLTAFHLLNKR